MRPIITFLLFTSFHISYGQNFVYPTLKSEGKSLVDFIPIGWKMLDSTHGDLNRDGINDIAIVLQHTDSISLKNSVEDAVLTQPRMLIILFKNLRNNRFTLIEQSNSFVLKHDDPAMDDPFQNVQIKNGMLGIQFRVFYNTGSWYVTNAAYKFRYQQKQFVLIGADKSSFHRATQAFEKYSYNFLTKKRILIKGDEEKGTNSTTSKWLNITNLKTLKTLDEPFNWEVEKDIFL